MKSIALTLFALLGLGLLMCPARAAEPKQPTPDELEKMEAAMPGQPRVQPKVPRKLLVFNRSWGYKHSAIPYGARALEIMARKTGAFEVVVTDDASWFEPEKLRQFDAIFFNNTNNEIFLPENYDKLSPVEKKQADQVDQRLKKSLVKYLKNGGGLAVVHAGVASFRNWPEYGEIVGARFDMHPWHEEVTVTVEEPDHPLTRAFKKKDFKITDEIYQFSAFSRDNLRVLLSLNTDKTDMTKKNIHRTDNDFALCWVKPYGKGRVFYSAFGHRHELFWNPMILQHWLDGVQFVLGDLPAEMSSRNN